MLERAPRRAIATALAIAAGGIGLAGCGSETKKDAWKVGVDCPAEAQQVHVNDLSQVGKLGSVANTGSASLAVTCQEGTKTVGPTGFELVSGEGTKIHQSPAPTDTITVKYSWETGDGFSDGDDPSIEFHPATIKLPAEIYMSGIKDVEAVDIGN